MTPRLLIFGVVTLALTFLGVWMLSSGTHSRAQAFEVATLHLEQNVSDGDLEVVFEVKGGSEGLSKLRIISPRGRIIADFNAADARTLGIRQFHLESPEPKNLTALKAAYPEGVYHFEGMAVSGKRFRGSAQLSHRLPAPAALVRPPEGVKTVAPGFAWTSVAEAARYLLTLERAEGGEQLMVELAAGTTSFDAPSGFLRAGAVYQLSIGTVLESGNRSFVETKFTAQ